MPIEIRQCTEDDLPALQELYRQLHSGEKPNPSTDELQQGFAAMSAFPGCQVYVVEVDARVLGTFTLYILPNLTRGCRPAAIIENIVVDEAHRGQGIGRAMLEYARAKAQAQGCYKLSLTSNAKRTESHAFYRQCGMVQHGVSFRYEISDLGF